MYKGIVPNLAKCAPASSVSFAGYEFTKGLMDKFAGEDEDEEYVEE